MEQQWLFEHQKTEAAYWWFVSRRALVRQLLRQHAPRAGRLLEVGCGGGLLSFQLQSDGWDVVSSDLFPAGAAFARRAGVRKALAFDAERLWPFPGATFDALVMLDVIEHLADDVGVLRQVGRVLRPGGIGIFLAPAYQFLFSAWDTRNGHHRRYTARRFAQAAQSAGLHVRRATYWNAISVLPAMALRLRKRNEPQDGGHLEFPPVPAVVNAGLIAYGKLEQAWLRRCPLPCGLSVLAVVQRNDEAT